MRASMNLANQASTASDARAHPKTKLKVTAGNKAAMKAAAAKAAAAAAPVTEDGADEKKVETEIDHGKKEEELEDLKADSPELAHSNISERLAALHQQMRKCEEETGLTGGVSRRASARALMDMR